MSTVSLGAFILSCYLVSAAEEVLGRELGSFHSLLKKLALGIWDQCDHFKHTFVWCFKNTDRELILADIGIMSDFSGPFLSFEQWKLSIVISVPLYTVLSHLSFCMKIKFTKKEKTYFRLVIKFRYAGFNVVE